MRTRRRLRWGRTALQDARLPLNKAATLNLDHLAVGERLLLPQNHLASPPACGNAHRLIQIQLLDKLFDLK
jgi:hypothetical protein